LRTVGFLALFGSLGGQFTFSKMSAAVYTIAVRHRLSAIFWLFTVFGGTTPGMMLRGLQVVDFPASPPPAKITLARRLVTSCRRGTFFLGFYGQCGMKRADLA